MGNQSEPNEEVVKRGRNKKETTKKEYESLMTVLCFPVQVENVLLWSRTPTYKYKHNTLTNKDLPSKYFYFKGFFFAKSFSLISSKADRVRVASSSALLANN